MESKITKKLDTIIEFKTKNNLLHKASIKIELFEGCQISENFNRMDLTARLHDSVERALQDYKFVLLCEKTNDKAKQNKVRLIDLVKIYRDRIGCSLSVAHEKVCTDESCFDSALFWLKDESNTSKDIF